MKPDQFSALAAEGIRIAAELTKSTEDYAPAVQCSGIHVRRAVQEKSALSLPEGHVLWILEIFFEGTGTPPTAPFIPQSVSIGLAHPATDTYEQVVASAAEHYRNMSRHRQQGAG